MNLGVIAKLCQGHLVGSGNAQIVDVCSIEQPSEKCITYVSDVRFARSIDINTGCAYIVTPEYADKISLGIIHKNPTQAFRIILNYFYPKRFDGGVADTAIISERAKLGNNVTVGHYAVISDDVELSDNCVVGSHTVIHSGSVIGAGTHLGSQITIHQQCSIGSRCMISDGVVIGGQGFGFSFEGGRWESIPQVGTVIIGDCVHIGANSCIDRGAINDTIIGNNVIIDNLVHIAHNVEVGERTAMAACVGIAGSTKVGKNCMLAGQVGVVGHINIADGVQVYGGARVLQSIKDPGAYAGSFHAMPVRQWNRIAVYLKKIETLFRKEKSQ